MVKLTKIYTRGGDEGFTSLGSGDRVAKYSDRPAAYGAVDEANAAIGLARLDASGTVDEALARIQNDLCLLYTSPSPRDTEVSRMPSSA